MGAATWAVQLDLVDAPVVQQWLFSFFAVSSATIGLGAHHTALPASLPAGQQPGMPSPPPPQPPPIFAPAPCAACIASSHEGLCKSSRHAQPLPPLSPSAGYGPFPPLTLPECIVWIVMMFTVGARCTAVLLHCCTQVLPPE